MLSEELTGRYVAALQAELICAMGCTEPIAIAYAGAVARKYLGALPDSVIVYASGNMIKNTKSVVVPNTGGMRGIPAAAAAGIVAGDPERRLEVISAVTAEQRQALAEFLAAVPVKTEPMDRGHILDIIVEAHSGEHAASVRICDDHTNITEITVDGNAVFSKKEEVHVAEPEADTYDFMNIRDIVDFADSVPLERVQPILERQIACNTAIAEEGLKGNYGANIGTVLLRTDGDTVKNRAKAMAAAGSDARMNGCDMPVVINSGSGNQGLTVSMPVLVYAKELRVSEEKKLRALLVSNLVAIHLKSGMGRLSAYCGAVSAGCASGAGIAYLYGGGETEISHTVVNALAITSGIICDGAKASCAAKIATAVEGGILGFEMYKQGQQFYAEDGIVVKGVENTIHNVARLAKDGMAETDKEIIRIMTNVKC